MRHILIAILLMLICYAAILLSSGTWKRTSIGKKITARKKRSPISNLMLRSPGDSLRAKELDAVLDYGAFVGLIPSIALLGYIYFISISNLKGPTVFLTVGIFAGSIMWCLSKQRMALKDLHSLRLGLDGEIATAHELNQLMLQGYYVYHDFPADNFNIDHIVIGPTGVFAVETKARPKPSAKGLPSAKVSFDGNILRFPDGQDSKFIKQTREQARWLADFLEKSVGKSISVSPVLTLPGWMVNRDTDIESPLVINPKEAVKIIPQRTDTLDEQTIQQIKFQVENKCRTVEPYEPVL